MKIVIKDADKLRVLYEDVMRQIGEGAAAKVFARALSREGSKTFTKVKRTIKKQTDIPPSMISAAMTFRSSSAKHLQTIISGSGKELPLRLFNPSQFKYGVRAKVWGKQQRYKSAFIVKSIGGNVFHRTGVFGQASKGRYQGQRRESIEKMYGPSIPKEMVKDAILQTFHQSTDDIANRVMHELSQLLKVK